MLKVFGETPELGFINLIIYGMIYGFGAIMPGMTTLHILIFLGVSGPIITGITQMDFNIIIPFVIGYLAVVLLIANLMTYFFEKFYGYTYYAIIGFSITSLIVLIPNIQTSIEWVLCPAVLIFSFLFMFLSR